MLLGELVGVNVNWCAYVCVWMCVGVCVDVDGYA